MSKFDPYAHLKISLNPDGTLNRTNKIPRISSNPNPSNEEAVASKDITISDEKKTWVRIYRPTKLPANEGRRVAKLPILIFYHNGGWIDLSVENILYHELCTHFTINLQAIVVSLDYRLAPEYRLPAQYDDALDSILWVRQQMIDPKGEQWLKDYGDFSRFYVSGRGNGANMAYHACIRALDVDLNPLRISGMILNQPMFGGNQRTKSELKYACDELFPLPVWDLMWELALPKGADRDHKYCNPLLDYDTQKNKLNKLSKCLLIGYTMDPMVDRQQKFVAMMVTCGAKIEAHFDVGFHGVDFVDSKRRSYFLQLVKEFLQ